jgi:hypothetical protein
MPQRPPRAPAPRPHASAVANFTHAGTEKPEKPLCTPEGILKAWCFNVCDDSIPTACSARLLTGLCVLRFHMPLPCWDQLQ